MNAGDLYKLEAILVQADSLVERVRAAVVPEAELGARRDANDPYYQLLCHLRTNSPARAHLKTMIEKELTDRGGEK